LAACNGGGSNGNSSSNPFLSTVIPVPNVTAGTNFSFDISAVDTATHRYYFTDRNNASVDVFDADFLNFIKLIPGFHGCDTGPTCAGANNDKSGPDGINLIPGTTQIHVGDVNAARIIDSTKDAVVNSVVIGGTSGFRADEGCYDPDHKIYMISSPGETPPFATFIDTASQKIIATVVFTDPGTGLNGPPSAGLEACDYDHASQSFYVNNDGSTANPHGELDTIPASAVLAGTPSNPVTLTLPATAGSPGSPWKIFPEGNCDPTGIALGPGVDVAVSCRQGTKGVPLTVQIYDRTNGTLLANLNAGGGDQIVYDAATNRYYYAASRWTSNGLSSGASCSAAAPCIPRLIVIDASTRSVVFKLTSGNNAHSVAFDPANHRAFMPSSSATAPAGCADCVGGNAPNGGVLVFQF